MSVLLLYTKAWSVGGSLRGKEEERKEEEKKEGKTCFGVVSCRRGVWERVVRTKE